MPANSLTHVSDDVLLRNLDALLAQGRTNTVDVLAHIAEVAVRRLYAREGYSSIFTYCVDKLHLSEDAAYKRIHVARAARRFPVLFTALADGRLHLSGAYLLVAHLAPENVDELIAAATHQRKKKIELLLAQRFPRPDVPEQVRAIPTRPAPSSTAQAGTVTADPPESGRAPVAAEPRANVMALTCQLAPGQVAAPMPPAKLTPLAPERFALQLTIDQDTHDMLRQAQDLLGHSLPSGELAAVLKRALKVLIEQLEKQKFAATKKPRQQRQASANPRHIPAHVKRAVRERDQDQCTFVSEAGQRCSERKSLEWDHTEPVARGGQSTVDNVRLRCRAHNQYEAERVFGAGFMNEKREARRVASDTVAGRRRGRLITSQSSRMTDFRRADESAIGAVHS